MASTSDIVFMRTKNWTPAQNISGVTPDISPWHVTIPGKGGTAPWPGLACETPLTGALETERYTGMPARVQAGEQIHDRCRELADEFINRVAGSSSSIFSVTTAGPQGGAGAATEIVIEDSEPPKRRRRSS